MDKKFRTRLISLSIQECAKNLSTTQIEGIFTEVIEDDGRALCQILKDIGRTSQGIRFLTLCQRENDLEKWSTFLRHESEKEGSKWNRKEIVTFHKKLSAWFESADKPYIDGLLKEYLGDLRGEITLNERDIRNWRTIALRKCLHNIIKGG